MSGGLYVTRLMLLPQEWPCQLMPSASGSAACISVAGTLLLLLLLLLLLPRHCPACLGYLAHVHEHEVAAFSVLELCMRPACGVSIPCSS